MTNDALKNLSSLLSKLIENNKKILEFEIKKKDAIINSDLQQLDDILRLEQPLVMNSESLEKRREKLEQEAGIYGLTLKEIVKEYDSDNVYFLKDRFDEMYDVLYQLKKANLTNTAILNTHLTNISHFFSLIDSAEGSNIYQKDGHFKQRDIKNTRELI